MHGGLHSPFGYVLFCQTFEECMGATVHLIGFMYCPSTKHDNKFNALICHDCSNMIRGRNNVYKRLSGFNTNS